MPGTGFGARGGAPSFPAPPLSNVFHMARFLLLLLLLPLLEAVLLVRLWGWVGGGPVLLGLAGTGLLGLWILRTGGMRTLRAARGGTPGDAASIRRLLGATTRIAAGLLLLVPGVVTDLLGLVLLFPPTRRLLHRVMQARLAAGLARGSVRVAAWSFGPGVPTDAAPGDGSSRPRPGFSEGHRSGLPIAGAPRSREGPRQGEIVQE